MTFIFIALCLNLFVTGGLIVVIDKQKSQLDAARAKLARIAATDDEIICVLEASESPLAKKLLGIAQAPIAEPPPLPPQQLPPKDTCVLQVTNDQFDALLDDMRNIDFDNYRLQMLKSWVEEAKTKHLFITSAHRSRIVAFFQFDNYRTGARQALAPIVRL